MKTVIKTGVLIIVVLLLTSFTYQTKKEKLKVPQETANTEESLIIEEPPIIPEETITEEKNYTDEELDLLARIINAEAGIMSDEAQLLVGNVVLNRVADARFPNTIRNVIYQKGQYAPTWDGSINNSPSKRALANAKRLMDGERFCDKNVVWQAEFKQGQGLYRQITENVNGYNYTMYFCY